MLDRLVKLRSREIVVDRLIRDCLDPPPGRDRRDLPVILLAGTRGSGKTALLDDIHGRCAGVRPCVLRDLEARELRPHEVAAGLAYGLNVRVKHFGRLRFPRLALGLVVIRADIDRRNRPRARAALRHLLLEDRRGLMAKVRELSDSLLKEFVAPPGSRTFVGLALDGIMAATVKLLRGPGFTWYREGLGRPFPDPLDALIDLSSLEADRTQGALAKVDEVLCGAFLADLRDAFATGLRAQLRTGNCVALLDNADSPTGRAFLEILVSERHRHAQRSPEDCDPLVVVAAGRTRFPSSALRDGRAVRTQKPDDATYDDWAGSRSRLPESWLYAVELGDLDEDELRAQAREWPDAAAVDHAAAFARRLTHGHLWSCGLVLRAVAAAAERAGAQSVDLRGILDWPDPDDPDRTLADAAIDRLLQGISAELRRDLITCAAACDVERASRRQAVGRTGARAVSEELERFCASDLWVHGAALHPFLRRVLLHALAGRAESDPDHWQSVHRRLRLECEGHDVTRAAYHTLALGEFASVVAHLGQRFTQVDKRSWLKEFDAITAAPRPVEPAVQTPHEQVWELSSRAAGGSDDALARLVAAVWISKDPLGDPGRTLNRRIAADFEQLALRAGREVDVFDDEAEKWRTPRQEGR